METEGKLAIPTYLKAWRLHRDVTQDYLANAIGKTSSTISQLENGKQGFTDKTLAALADALRCSPLDLLAYDPSRNDSFWPLFREAEKLVGAERRRAFLTIAAVTRPIEGESE